MYELLKWIITKIKVDKFLYFTCFSRQIENQMEQYLRLEEKAAACLQPAFRQADHPITNYHTAQLDELILKNQVAELRERFEQMRQLEIRLEKSLSVLRKTVIRGTATSTHSEALNQMEKEYRHLINVMETTKTTPCSLSVADDMTDNVTCRKKFLNQSKMVAHKKTEGVTPHNRQFTCGTLPIPPITVTYTGTPLAHKLDSHNSSASQQCTQIHKPLTRPKEKSQNIPRQSKK